MKQINLTEYVNSTKTYEELDNCLCEEFQEMIYKEKDKNATLVFIINVLILIIGLMITY